MQKHPCADDYLAKQVIVSLEVIFINLGHTELFAHGIVFVSCTHGMHTHTHTSIQSELCLFMRACMKELSAEPKDLYANGSNCIWVVPAISKSNIQIRLKHLV